CNVIGSPSSMVRPVLLEIQLAISSVCTVINASPGVLSESGMSRANAGKQHPAAAMAAIRIVLRIGVPPWRTPQQLQILSHSRVRQVTQREDSDSVGREAIDTRARRSSDGASSSSKLALQPVSSDS